MTFWKKNLNENEPQNTKNSALENPVINPAKIESAPKEPPASKPASPATAEAETAGASLDPLTQKYGRVRSALGPGTIIQGKLSFDTPVRIDGKLSGEVFSSKALIVGPTGQIDATIEAACLVVLGQVRGTVKATEKIELHSGALLEGKVQTPSLVIESGARFQGECDMGTRAKTTTAAVNSERRVEGKPVTTVLTNESIDLGNILAQPAAKEAQPAKKESAGEEKAKAPQPSLH